MFENRSAVNQCKIERFSTLSDWLKNLAPLSQPIRSTTKTNRDLLAQVFPPLCICFEF